MNNNHVNDFAKRYSATLRYDIDYRRQGYDGKDALGSYNHYIARPASNVIIDLPINAFEWLVNVDNEAERNYLAGQKEEILRKAHPALETAYSQYKMLLALYE